MSLAKTRRWIAWLPGMMLITWDGRLTDPTFLPGWMSLLVFITFLLFTHRSVQRWTLARMEALLGVVVLWVWLSTIWSTNPGEALLNNWRWTIGLVAMIVLRTWSSSRPHGQLVIQHSLVLSTCLYYAVITIALVWQALSGSQDAYDFIYPAGHKSIAAGITILLLSLVFLAAPSANQRIQGLLLIWATVLLFLLQSRTAFLGWLILIMAVVFTEGKKCLSRSQARRYLSLGAILALVLCVFYFRQHPLLQRFNPANFYYSETAQHRLLAWQKTINLIQDHPILGVGSGNWKIHLASTGVHPYWLNPEVDREWIFTRAHNDWLESTAELGLIGGLLYLVWLIYLVFLSLKIASPAKYFALATLAIFAVIASLDFPKERAEFALLMATLTVLIHYYQPDKTYPFSGLKFGLILITICSLGYGLWRYPQEIKIKKLLQARSQQDHTQVLKLKPHLSSSWYSVDFSGMPLAWYGGVAAYELQRYKEALDYFLKAHQAHPFAHQVLNNLGSTYWQLADTALAIQTYERCIALHPAFEEPRFNLAVILANSQNYQQAETILQPVTRDTFKKNDFLNRIEQLRNGQFNE